MANYWWSDYTAEFTGDENDLINQIRGSLIYGRSIYFYGFVSASNQEIIDVLLKQDSSGYQVSNLGLKIMGKAQAVTASGEDEKWLEFKNSWSINLQPAIQIIINKERIGTLPATTFDDFAARTYTEQAQNILDLDTDPYNFWMPYIGYFKQVAQKYENGWSAWIESLPQDYSLAIAEMAEKITAFGVTGLEDYEEFAIFKTLTPQQLASKLFINNKEEYINGLYWLPVYLASKIRNNTDEIFIGYYATEDQRKEAFISLFQTELQAGIRAYIETLIGIGYITSFDGLNNLSAANVFAITQIIPPDTTHAQTDRILTNSFRNLSRSSLQNISKLPENGDKFTFSINEDARLIYTYSSSGIITDITNLINNSIIGDWPEVTAGAYFTVGVDVTANVNNTPFNIRPVSILTTIAGYMADGVGLAEITSNHPIFFSIAQMILNDANLIDTAKLQVTKNITGVISYKNENDILQPADNTLVNLWDIDDIDLPVYLGAFITKADGKFNFSYTIENSYKTSKKLRLQAKDQFGTTLLITTDQDPNLFADAAHGTFEGGTPPDYTAWNLVKGTDIKIGEGHVLGTELQVNGHFYQSVGGWYTNFPQTTLFVNPHQGEVQLYFSLYTDNILTIGKTYRIQYTLSNIGGGNFLRVRDTLGTTIFNHGSFVIGQVYEVVFDATTSALRVDGNYIELSYFSIKEVTKEANTYKGNFSPKFYLDDTTTTDEFVFKGDTAIAVTTHTEYKIEAYVYFEGPIVKIAAEVNSGLYLRPVTFDLDDLTETIVHNGNRQLVYNSDEIKRSTSVINGQWVRLSSSFNSGASTSIKIGVYLKGTLSDYLPNFSFQIDQVSLVQGAAESKDITVTVTALTPNIGVYLYSSEEVSIDHAISQAAGASAPQISNIFPDDVQFGDEFILDLNHQGYVSFVATEATVANVTQGLTAAVNADSANIAITTPTPAGVSDAQVSRLTISNIKVGAKYTLRLNNGQSVTYVATTTSADDVVAGLATTINEQTANFSISLFQVATRSTPHVIFVTPTTVRAGSKFILTINGKDPIEFITSGTTVAEVVTAFVSAINANDEEWINVKATAGPSDAYIVLTANELDTRFSIQQVGGTWKSVYATQDTANDRVVVTANTNNVPFSITQIGGVFKSVFATDETFFMKVTANANNIPFDLYVKVVKSSESSFTMNAAFAELDVIPSATVLQSLGLKGIYTIKDLLAQGGLSVSIDGGLSISITTPASVGVKQVMKLVPLKANTGDIFSLYINGTNAVTYVATTANYADVMAGLITAIAAGSGAWTTVTATAVAATPTEPAYIRVEANSTNSYFSIQQRLAGQEQAVKKIDAIASLYTLVDDPDLTESQQIEVINALMNASMNDAFSVTAVSKDVLASTINHIIGDFKTARLYEVALARKAYTQQLMNGLTPSSKGLTGVDPNTENLLNSILKESCACDDCETAVSPLAYLTDLTNYVLKNSSIANSNGTTESLTIDYLNTRFHQDFKELPASCEDVINRVCQLRAATEVMRRYLAAQAPTGARLQKLQEDIRLYLNDLYRYLLISFDTSYDEIRLTQDEDEKRNLALRLGIDYDSNPDFLNKLFISPDVLTMDTWDEYKELNNKEIHDLIDDLSSSLSPGVNFAAFKTLSPNALRTLLVAFASSNAFNQTLAQHIVDTAGEVSDKVNALQIPEPLKFQMRWDMLTYELTKKFSVNFKLAFETFVSAYRTMHQQADHGPGMGLFYWLIAPDVSYSQRINNIAGNMTGMLGEGTQYLDFWGPLASALLSKVEDFSISELDIEELFGIPDSTKDVYSDGAKVNDVTNILKRWNIRGIEWGRNTDHQGYIYLGMDEIGVSISLYKDASRAPEFKVGIALPDTTGKFILSEFNDGGLTGELVVVELDADSTIAISAVPLLLSWKLNGLRALWSTADHFAETPVIDPDVIGAADILYPYDIDTTTPTKAIDFWKKRKELLEAKYEDYKDAREAADHFNHYGTSGIGAAQLDEPSGVALDSTGVLYIADTANARIQKLTGTTVAPFVSTGADSGPKQLLVTANDKIIVANSGTSLIKQFSTAGSQDWSFGASGVALGTFTSPYGVSLGTRNDLYVSDRAVIGGHTGRIQRFTLPYDYSSYTQIALLTIRQITAAATGVKQVTNVVPSRIGIGDTFKLTLQGTGSITYVATSTSVQEVVSGLIHAISYAASPWSSVVAVNKDTYIEFTAASTNTAFTLSYEPVPFATAANITVDAEGNRYVSDRYNGRVIKVNDKGELLKVFGNASSLAKDAQLLFRFLEEDGTTTRDSAGTGTAHNGTISGTADWQGDETFRSALHLVSAASVSIATSAALDNGSFSKRSLELWFKADGTSGRQVIYKHGSDTQGMNVYIYNDKLYVGIYGTTGGAWANFLSTNRLEADKWHHLIVVFDHQPQTAKNKFRAYLDGLEFLTDSTGNSGAGVEATSNGLYLGVLNGSIRFEDTTSSTTGSYFLGKIARFRVWNRALDQNEVNALYSKSESRDGSLYLPGALAIDKAGNLYVGDTGNLRVVKFDPSGVFIAAIGEGYGTGNGEFKSIDALAIDKFNGTFYVADITEERIQKFNDFGVLDELLASPAFHDPTSMTVDNDGVLYVADKGNSKIRLFNSNGSEGTAITKFDEGGDINFSAPSAVSIDANGNLVILDEDLSKLVLMNNATTLYSLHGGPWDLTDIASASMAIDADNYIYLGYGTQYTRLRFPEQITTITLPAGIVLTAAYFNNPSGMATDRNGNIWIADTSHHRILKITSKGIYLNDIGKSNNTSGTGNGEFNAPEFVTLDEAGNLYVSDTGNNRIQKFDSSGEYLCQWEQDADIFEASTQNAPTGLVLNKDRKLFVAQKGLDQVFVFDSMQGMSAAIDAALGFSLGELIQLSVSEKQGNDISDALTDSFLSYQGYRRLLALAGMADRRIELLDEQLDDLYNVLVRAYKEARFTQWKLEEETAGLLLSQDYFVIPLIQQEEDLVFNPWLVYSKERRNWTNTLKSRIEQQNALHDAYEEILSETDSAFLIRLRDILIMASGFIGDTIDQKAVYGSNILLIDLKNACCQKTTRISQALEVLQNLMWGLRNGILSDTIKDIRINTGINFEEDWKWMGSYSTWKAAQFVFLYPENLLQPAYNNERSGGFKSFAENLQLNPQLSVQTLEDYVADFYDYFDDVNSLQMLDSIQAPTLIQEDAKEIRGTQSNTYKNYIYLFARGSKSDGLYWTKLSSKKPYEQLDFWNKIDVEDGASLKLIRVTRVKFPDNKLYLVVFLLDDRTDTPKLQYIKYDLQTGDWNLEPVEVDIPDFDDGFGNVTGKFKGVYVNRNNSGYDLIRGNDGIFSGDSPTEVVIFIHRGVLQAPYRFDKELKKLKQIGCITDADWPIGFYAQLDNNKRPVRRASEVYWINEYQSFYVNSDNDPNNPQYFIGGEQIKIRKGYEPQTVVSATTWADALDWRQYRKIFFYRKSSYPSLFYIVVESDKIVNAIPSSDNKVIFPAVLAESTFQNASYISNAFVSEDYGIGNKPGDIRPNVIVYQTPDGTIRMAQPYLNRVDGTIKLFFEISRQPLAVPFQKISIDQYPQPNSVNNTNYKSYVSDVYGRVSQSNKYVKRLVQELYYSVPMSAALALQKRGLYEEALKWYKLVYDFTEPDITKRVIYDEFRDGAAAKLIDNFNTNNGVDRQGYGGAVISIQNDSGRNGRGASSVGYYTTTNVASSGILYKLGTNHNIDLDDPQFSLYVYNPTYAAPQVISIEIGKENEDRTNYAVHTATLAGSGWQKLNFKFSRKGNLPLANVNALKIQIYPFGSSKVYYLDDFAYNKPIAATLDKSDAWLSDPINPHALAANRADAYVRFMVLSLASCLIEYADSEFTKDNAESVPRARLLYENALDLMKGQGLGGTQELCREAINALDISFSDEWNSVWLEIRNDLYKVKDRKELTLLLADIRTVFADTGSEPDKLKIIRNLVDVAISDPEIFKKISEGIDVNEQVTASVYLAMQANPDVQANLLNVTFGLRQNYINVVTQLTGVSPSVLLSDRVFSGTYNTVLNQLVHTDEVITSGNISLDMITGDVNDLEDWMIAGGTNAVATQYVLKDLNAAISKASKYAVTYKPSTNFTYCIPSNPLVEALRFTAEINLFKIRSCRNIAGEVRELDPFAAAISVASGLPNVNGGASGPGAEIRTFTPSQYRYETLIERAKQLVQIAQQIEASLLATLEKLDAERYSMLKAKQDLSLSKAGVKLQDLRSREAESGVKLAELQKERSELQYDHYTDLINEGLLTSEIASLEYLKASIVLNSIASVLFAIGGSLSTVKIGSATSIDAGSAISGIAQALSTQGGVLNTFSSLSSMTATFERRNQEWKFQKDLAQKDVAIGGQQVKIAKDQLAVVGQERNIAQLQTDNAEATIDFLSNKFTNTELYDWMSGVLEKVYRVFLQQATATARLAANQLSFERQQLVTDYIQNDYWQAPVDNLLQAGTLPGEKTVDRKGITGSTRLLQDIYLLDQDAFSGDVRRLEMTKTISLATQSPSEFQRFKATGEFPFELSMTPFDRDFPGHYLRLIRSVKTSVIALVPPIEGIKATLSNTGSSRVVIENGNNYQKIQVKRTPESVALTSTSNANGLFELNPVNNNKLLPFEKTGVESQWIFNMPKASNFFDYETIADVLITIEYTALSSDLYRSKVIKELGTELKAYRSFSFKNNFADQWYDLNNPSDPDAPEVSISFSTSKTDFPANVRDVLISDLLLYFVASDTLDPENGRDAEPLLAIENMTMNNGLSYQADAKSSVIPSLKVNAVKGVISTTALTGEEWLIFRRKSVEAIWTLTFTKAQSQLFREGHISDLLFVISYEAETASF